MARNPKQEAAVSFDYQFTWADLKVEAMRLGKRKKNKKKKEFI